MKTQKAITKISVCIVNPKGYALYNKASKLPYGGGEIQLYLLSKELVNHPELKVSVVTGDYNLKKFRLEIISKIKLFIVSKQNRSIFNYIMRPMSVLVTLFLIKPDIVIQRIGGINSGICALYCKLFRKKFIYSISHEKEVTKRGLSGFQYLTYQFGLINANYIIAQYYNQIERLKKWKRNRIFNIKIIKSGYKIPKKSELLKKRKHILWVGRAVAWKQPEIFLKLAKEFPSQKFVMILKKDKFITYWNDLQNQAKKIHNLLLYKFIEFHKINDYFMNAIVFINTSRYEGFPNTFVQALMNSTPIISLNVDPDNFLTINKCGFNCNNNFDVLKNKLNLILKKDTLYEKLANNSYNYAKENHDIKITSNHWINLIKFLITKD